MYRSDLGAKDKGGAIAAVVAIHAALLFALLNMSGRMDLPVAQAVMRVFDIDELKPPPPPPPPPPPQRQQSKPRDKEGGAAPPNIKSEATPVVAPKPEVVIPPVPQIAASETPRQGTAPTQGAAPVTGPGTGAGGVGTGTGSGAGGSGPGGGGDGGAAYPPRLLTPTLRGRDFDQQLVRSWPRGGDVFVGLRVLPNGTVSECKIFRSSGVGAIDSEVCNLAHQRFRFRPALNRNGQPVASWFGYRQAAL
jgi:periplasmic protein TonB